MAQEFFHSGKKPVNQADQRRSFNPRDQFGRKWLGCLELASGDLCEIVPAGWMDPLRTPVKFIHLATTEEGQTDMSRVVVDMAAWLREIREHELAWYEELHRNALHVYRAVDPKDVPTLDQDRFLQDLTGPKPFPGSAVIQQALEGDRQYLGIAPLDRAHRGKLRMNTLEDLRAEPEPEVVDATPTAEDTYQTYLARAMKAGKTMKEAAGLWNARKAEPAGV